jgi:hypothetical protein
MLNLALTVPVYHFDAIVNRTGIQLDGKSNLPACLRAWRHFEACDNTVVLNDPMKRVRGWDRLGMEAAALRQLHTATLFLADDRDVLAQLEYSVRDPHPLDAIQWNPQHRIDSHYALTTTMDDKRGRDFLYISRNDRLPSSMEASFADTQALPRLHVDIHPNYALDFHVWLLHDFRGYQ